jgi:hypothetical protein
MAGKNKGNERQVALAGARKKLIRAKLQLENDSTNESLQEKVKVLQQRVTALRGK